MICQPCRKGGQIAADSKRVTDEGTADYLLLRAIEAHGQCPGDCGCQHVIGQSVLTKGREG